MNNGSKNFKSEEIDQFGSNSWFVEYLYEEYKDNPQNIPEQWRHYFANGGEMPVNVSPTAGGAAQQPGASVQKVYPKVAVGEGDEPRVIAGGAAKIIENMENSMMVPTATSVRNIPVKLLEENRVVINSYLAKFKSGKVSFTHIIGWAIVQAAKKYPVMNNAYAEVNGKPTLIKRGAINLGIAIDVEKKDGSRTLVVPNIKDAGSMTFGQYLDAYESLVKRSRTGQIDPAEFQGTTVSLTNPGTIGTIASVPRLMTGQGTIVATGAIQYPAEYQAMSTETISKLGISKILTITSTYDHRIIQGAESGMFLKEVHSLLIGEGEFYENIFNDLQIPMKALKWETDISPALGGGSLDYDEIAKQGRVRQMINMYRVRGHLVATIDPLGSKTHYHEELDPAFYGLTMWDLDRKFVTHDFGGMRIATLREILAKLNRTYCENIGVEYMHIQSPEEKAWLSSRMEPVENKPNFDSYAKKTILHKLMEAEEFEHFIHTKFVGHKRFSLEGNESVIPMLDYLLTIAADNGVKEIVLGMAHRGRLNVLTNIIGKSYDSILSEFEDIIDPNSFAGSGDVKYHLGAHGKVKTRSRREIGVTIASNPSHLEWVNPVIEGIVRAKQNRMGDLERRYVMPLLIHGDAAFAGQGVVAETINLSQLVGYKTGGTIHLIINNQIGFTTTPEDARSSQYATDVAKMVQAPIFHVNGDDPESVLWVTKLAFEYKHKFKKDVVIDVMGYRRHGHNEADDPGYTQPLMYEKIKKQPSVTKIYKERLIKENMVTEDEFVQMKSDYLKLLNDALDLVQKRKVEFKIDIPLAVSSEKIRSAKPSAKTAITEENFRDLLIKGSQLPEDFNLHPKLRKFLEKRVDFANNPDAVADWATGEFLAFASLLKEGVPIRLSGEDVVRGTFSHRHLAFTDVKNGHEYFPVNHMYPEQAKIEALDSLLSEAAVLGFEYGYSTADPLCLVLWEAQFGDFANCAQVIIDNFIVASKEKWDTPNNLVLLLPHGFEGQGPEHSSARLERFLILCAQDNMEVVYPTEPAQIFHLLRRQMKKDVRRPLVVMTPKSLLRLPEAKSYKNDFITGTFKEIIDDATITDKKSVKRLILTSGKVYYDLIKYRAENKITDTAIVRIEQLYPYEKEQIREVTGSYSNAAQVVWVQEEPKNMGAWNFLMPRLYEDIENPVRLRYVGRPSAASPAVGSAKLTMQQQQNLVREALTINGK